MLQRLNTGLVANGGLVVGVAAIGTAIGGFFRVASDPDELVALYEVTQTHTDPTHALARIAGAGIGVVGAVVLSLVMTYLGRPSTLPKT